SKRRAIAMSLVRSHSLRLGATSAAHLRCRNRSITWRPRNPKPPVTRTRLFRRSMKNAPSSDVPAPLTVPSSPHLTCADRAYSDLFAAWSSPVRRGCAPHCQTVCFQVSVAFQTEAVLCGCSNLRNYHKFCSLDFPDPPLSSSSGPSRIHVG